MRRLVDLVKLDRLDSLIRRHATGSPVQLAARLEMSRSSLFEFISFLRYEMQAPIQYSKSHNSYIYEYVPKFYLGFEKERLSSSMLYNTYGKNDDDGKVYSENDNSDDFILDDDKFNDLYLYE
ncbi:MAG: hypothetical protein LBS69_04395 [Prevotellaceae bacterium]|jgi:hypothetical protein|nr:hypothetical protein [Prevotellaceae bacterium]